MTTDERKARHRLRHSCPTVLGSIVYESGKSAARLIVSPIWMSCHSVTACFKSGDMVRCTRFGVLE